MTENIKETTEEVKEYIVARLKVPIFFYYLLALAIWNWDILVMIIKSNFEIESVIWFIKTNYSGHGRIWKPFLIALGSSIFFPGVMVGLDWFLKFVNKERIKSAKQVAEAEADAQYDIQVKRNRTDKLQELNTKITVQQTDIDVLKLEKADLAKQNKKLVTDISKSEGNLVEQTKLKEEIQKQLETVTGLYELSYKIDDFEQINSEVNSFTSKYSPFGLLGSIEFYITKNQNKDNFKNKEYLKILIDGEYISEKGIDELPFPTDYELTKRGFALYYYLLGLTSKSKN